MGYIYCDLVYYFSGWLLSLGVGVVGLLNLFLIGWVLVCGMNIYY